MTFITKNRIALIGASAALAFAALGGVAQAKHGADDGAAHHRHHHHGHHQHHEADDR